ncbi:unnamed protein product [Trichogramma brassicae]|uniref:Uncharacterized protein n=1 Tax=Trichogramma brassicae TaxID=86971 RepID=A0A6H5I220_9HYME|nr:unnamed protein product [Trichogramma brassicae]
MYATDVYYLHAKKKKKKQQNSDLLVAVYECRWWALDRRDARSVLLIMERAQRPLQLTAGKFCVLSFRLFAIVPGDLDQGLAACESRLTHARDCVTIRHDSRPRHTQKKEEKIKRVTRASRAAAASRAYVVCPSRSISARALFMRFARGLLSRESCIKASSAPCDVRSSIRDIYSGGAGLVEQIDRKTTKRVYYRERRLIFAAHDEKFSGCIYVFLSGRSNRCCRGSRDSLESSSYIHFALRREKIGPPPPPRCVVSRCSGPAVSAAEVASRVSQSGDETTRPRRRRRRRDASDHRHRSGAELRPGSTSAAKTILHDSLFVSLSMIASQQRIGSRGLVSSKRVSSAEKILSTLSRPNPCSDRGKSFWTLDCCAPD